MQNKGVEMYELLSNDTLSHTSHQSSLPTNVKKWWSLLQWKILCLQALTCSGLHAHMQGDNWRYKGEVSRMTSDVNFNLQFYVDVYLDTYHYSIM
jgi:hypothetical protein